MKPTIEELVLQIVSTALIITQQGKWHAFVDLQGHVELVTVWICPADTDYTTRGYPKDRRTCYWANDPHEWRTPEEHEHYCHEEMSETLAWLQGFLDMPAAPAQERAA